MKNIRFCSQKLQLGIINFLSEQTNSVHNPSLIHARISQK